jgi:hypothetical protein
MNIQVLKKTTIKATFFCLLLIIPLLLRSFPVLAGEPTYRQGADIFIEKGVDPPDRTPAWYAPQVGKPYAPVFEILAILEKNVRF